MTTDIVDNDSTNIVVSNVTVNEDAGFAVFSVSLTKASATATNFSLSLANGTATQPSDYSNALEVSTDGGTTWTSASAASIAANSTATVLVRTPIATDNITESSESFTLTATVNSGTTSNLSAFGIATIIDNDTPPVLDLNRTATAGNDYTTTFTEKGASVSIGNNVSITDAENSNIINATITHYQCPS